MTVFLIMAIGFSKEDALQKKAITLCFFKLRIKDYKFKPDSLKRGKSFATAIHSLALIPIVSARPNIASAWRFRLRKRCFGISSYPPQGLSVALLFCRPRGSRFSFSLTLSIGFRFAIPYPPQSQRACLTTLFSPNGGLFEPRICFEKAKVIGHVLRRDSLFSV